MDLAGADALGDGGQDGYERVEGKTGQSGVTAEVALYGYTAIEDLKSRLTIPSRLVFINLSVSSQYLRAEWSRTGRNGAKYLPSLMG